MAWCVCHFQIDDSVEVVPNNWITSESQCVWPSTKKLSKLSELIKKREFPKDDWKAMNIRILGRYDDYKTAERKCKTAMDRDNLSSLSEAAEYGKGHRDRKRKKIYSDSDTEESREEELSINFPMYNADKIASSSNLAHKTNETHNNKTNSTNETHNDKTNSTNKARSNITNNVYQFNENKKQNSDNILTEVHTDLKKHSNEMKEFQRQVLRHLHIINARMGELYDHVDSLKPNPLVDEENINQNIVNEVSLQCIESLPVKSNLELQEIERTLQDKEIFHDVATELSKMGGNNLRIIVKKVMCRILTPEVGREYSWEGHKGNLIFKDLILAKLVLKSVRLTTKKSLENITDNEIINAVKTWLVKAKLKTKQMQQNEANQPVQQNEANRSTCDREH